MALRREVVHFIGFDRVEQPAKVTAVRQIAVMQVKPGRLADARSIARKQAVHLVTFPDQQLRQVIAILSGNAGDEGDSLRGFSHDQPSMIRYRNVRKPAVSPLDSAKDCRRATAFPPDRHRSDRGAVGRVGDRVAGRVRSLARRAGDTECVRHQCGYDAATAVNCVASVLLVRAPAVLVADESTLAEPQSLVDSATAGKDDR